MKMNSLMFSSSVRIRQIQSWRALEAVHFSFLCVQFVWYLLYSNRTPPPSERNMKDLNIELLAIISDLGGLVYHVLLVYPPIRNFLFTVNLLLLSVFTLIWNQNPAIFSSCLHMILLIW